MSEPKHDHELACSMIDLAKFKAFTIIVFCVGALFGMAATFGFMWLVTR